MLKRFGFPEAIFSINSFIAAMLALYIAFSIGLPRPYWAMLTVYITVQPLSGALRSKAVYRVIGTVVGGIVAVVMVPNLVDAPMVLSLAMASWVGICLYLSLLDRTPRAYVFMLAGYTAGIIGFPSVNAPETVFDTALSRVEEITLGILCASLVHTIVFPRSVLAALNARINAILRDAEAWATESWAEDVLTGNRHVRADRSRQRLAADITEIHILSTHLPFDTANLRPTLRIVGALQDRLSLILPLATAVEDRRRALRAAGGMSDEIVALLGRTRDWVARGATGTREEALALTGSCAAGQPVLGTNADWPDLMKASLLGRLGELIDDLQDARELAAHIAAPDRPLPAKLTARVSAVASRRLLHRDHGLAALSGFAAFIAILGCCAFWIATAWPEGAVAPLSAAIFASFFAAQDDPAPSIAKFMISTMFSFPIAAFYIFAVLPAIDGFPMLVAVLAPAFLILGAMQGNPATYPLAIPLILGVAGSLSLQAVFSADFPSFTNNFIAQIVGIGAALVATQLFRSVGADFSARRLLRFGWRDLSINAAARPEDCIDRGVWTSRMLDRLGLLLPRLALVERPDTLLSDADILNDLRIGLNVADLQQARTVVGPVAERSVARLLGDVAGYFRRHAAADRAALAPSFLADIDTAIGDVAADGPSPQRQICLWSLAGLRRNLFPSAAPYSPAITGDLAS